MGVVRPAHLWLEAVKINKKILIVFLLSVLVIMSFVQSTQINSIKKSFIGSVTGVITASPSANANSYSTPAANVPAMVGGC